MSYTLPYNALAYSSPLQQAYSPLQHIPAQMQPQVQPPVQPPPQMQPVAAQPEIPVEDAQPDAEIPVARSEIPVKDAQPDAEIPVKDAQPDAEIPVAEPEIPVEDAQPDAEIPVEVSADKAQADRIAADKAQEARAQEAQAQEAQAQEAQAQEAQAQEAQAQEQQQKRVSFASAFVGEEVPVSALVRPSISDKLRKAYPTGYKIKGDGNCYYRALGYAIIQQWISDKNTDKFKRLLRILGKNVNIPPAWSAPLANFYSYIEALAYKQWLTEWDWNNPENDKGLIYTMKYVAIVQMQEERPEFFPNYDQLLNTLLNENAWAENQLIQIIPNALGIRVCLVRVPAADVPPFDLNNNLTLLGKEEDPVAADLLYHDRTHFDVLVPNLQTRINRQLRRAADVLEAPAAAKPAAPAAAKPAAPAVKLEPAAPAVKLEPAAPAVKLEPAAPAAAKPAAPAVKPAAEAEEECNDGDQPQPGFECKRDVKSKNKYSPRYDPAQCFGTIQTGEDKKEYEAIWNGKKYMWKELAFVDGKSVLHEIDEDMQEIRKLPCARETVPPFNAYPKWPHFDAAKCIGETRTGNDNEDYTSKRTLQCGPRWYKPKK
jgi:hypothetical protein